MQLSAPFLIHDLTVGTATEYIFATSRTV